MPGVQAQLSADWTRISLKPIGPTLDSSIGMRTQELRLRVQRAEYAVEPAVVAEAMLRHAVSHRRWWNPRTVCAAPPADSTTSGGPSTVSPIHVNEAADSVSARMSGAAQTHSS